MNPTDWIDELLAPAPTTCTMPTVRATEAPEPHRDRAWEDATGWKIARWPHHTLGTHCPCWILRGRVCDGPCSRDMREEVGWPVWDHARRVKSPTGARAILLQPFWIDSATIAKLSAYCTAHGLSWLANGCSPYAPGSTMTIVVYRAGTDPELPWLDGDPRVVGAVAAVPAPPCVTCRQPNPTRYQAGGSPRCPECRAAGTPLP